MSLVIAACHHSASLVMPIGDPRDRFLYHTLTLMMGSYILCEMTRNKVEMTLTTSLENN